MGRGSTRPRVDSHAATAVNFENNNRAPLLLISGGKDHVSPASVVEANFKLYRKSEAITDCKEFPERTHYTWSAWMEKKWQITRSTGRHRTLQLKPVSRVAHSSQAQLDRINIRKTKCDAAFAFRCSSDCLSCL
jgi:hypothetical protein